MNQPSTRSNDCVLEVTREFSTSPEMLFDCFTQAEQLAKWFAPDPSLLTEVRDIDLSVGGQYEIAMINHAEGKAHVVVGEYREIDRPHRLVYTWHWQSEQVEEVSLVTLEFEPCDAGTRLHLRHERFASDQSRDQHAHGWQGCLERLATLHA